ncbi:MAG: putative toxin-antitoxin system toxin component, PIN family [Ammonifex sp.]|nr:MAG: putative toxin-antitoxin system toxin component, PIN family [Ammonifex sp.]
MDGSAGTVRIVVDTNVLMGGLINPVKASGRVINLWQAGKVEVLISSALREEYLHTFARMRFGEAEAVKRRESALKRLLAGANTTLVEPEFRLQVIREDHSDNRLIECAVSGGADYIVSQDRHLLRVGQYDGIRILTAHHFLMLEHPGCGE